MKRMLSALFAGGLLLSLAACQTPGASKDTAIPTQSQPSAVSATAPAPTSAPAEPSAPTAAPEDAAVEVQQLMEQFWELAGTDYDSFAALFRNTDEATVQSEFSSDINVRQYDSKVCIPVVSSGPYSLMNVTYYIITGAYPDAHMDATHLNVAVSCMDGVWKFDYSQEAVDALSKELDESRTLYPEEGRAAFEAGRNWVVFNSENYMYADADAVFRGYNHMEVKFAWQDQDGNLSLALWMANGTDTNLYNKTMDLVITDSALGEIVNVTGVELGVPVKAMSGLLYQVAVPADQVKTGTQTWGAVSTSLNYHTD